MSFRFETLDIWKDSSNFVEKVYKISKKFPKQEMFALSNQIRRSASSISANIAEGSGAGTKKDFSHYLDISIKSIFETVSHLYLANQQGYILEKERQGLYDEAEVLVKKIQSFKKWLNK